MVLIAFGKVPDSIANRFVDYSIVGVKDECFPSHAVATVSAIGAVICS